tara:strand:+ start:32856 stop:33524 length:669 start_codon:yes stop_codon:yes gene_type:complete
MTTTKTAAPRHEWLPWAWCNLRRNPFGELSRDERARLAVVNAPELARLVENQRHAVQLIGECGRGKTTRMLALQKYLPDASYTYLAEDQPCGPIPVGRPILIDEAQRLTRRARRAIFCSGLPLVLATHRDLSRPLSRAGYHVTTQWIGQHADAEHISQIMNRRIEAARLANGPVPTLSMQQADQLVARFGSDIRKMEAFLYDNVQQQKKTEGMQRGEMRFID